MKKDKLWRLTKTLLKFGLVILLLSMVLKKINFQEVKLIFLKCNLWYVVCAFISYFLSQIVSSWRLLSFLKGIGLTLSFGFNFRLYLLGMFYNVFLPGGVGGDGYKIYLLRRRFKKPTKKLLISTLLDRISGLWAIGTISVLLIILIPQLQIPRSWAILTLVLGTLLYYLILQKYFNQFIKRFFEAHCKAILVQSLQLLAVIFILLSLNFSGQFSPYLFSFLISSLATIIAGFGPREFAMIQASDFFGMDHSLAIFVTVTFYLVSTLAAVPGAYFAYRTKEFEPMPNVEGMKEVENDVEKPIESPL